MTRALPLAIVAALALAPLVLPPYYLTLMSFAGLAAIVVLGLVLLTGFSGVISFGQATFVGISAYTTAILTTTYGFSPWAALPVAVIVTGVVAALIGWLTLGLSGHYLPLSTLAWSLALFFLAGNLPKLGGHDGLGNLPPLSVLGHALDAREYTWLIWLGVGLAFLSVQNLLDSRTGRAIRALPKGKVLLGSVGARPERLRLLAFVHAAALAALSGWLYAHMMRFVSPTPFGISAGIEYLFMAVIGGVASLWGALIGAGAVILGKDILQDIVPGLTGSTGAAETIVFGIAIVLILQFRPEGIGPRFIPRHRADDTAQPLQRGDKPAPGTPILEAQGLSKRFGGLAAVSELGFSLQAGAILGLIGPNGAGKTTAFNLLSGVLRPSAGQVRFRDQPLDHLRQADITRLGLARTFQHVRLRPEMSVLENVAIGAHARGQAGALSAIFGRDRAEESRILSTALEQLHRVGLAELADKPVGDLPLGTQRIVEIARALAADPVLLLLDEPAAGLRHGEKQQLDALLRQLRAEGLTLMIVEHDMGFLMGIADRVLVLNFGELIAQGSPADIRANPVVQRAYLGEDAA